MLTRLGVLGWPVAHSRSPAIHNAALEHAGLRHWRYQLLPVPPELFAETVRALPGAGFRGANVTIPHKQAALALATDATARARAIGAANTLVFDTYADGDGEGAGDGGGEGEGEGEGKGAVWADNTDAPALIASVPITLAGATALVLGAGGSARAAVWALLDAGASQVSVWNRTTERAQALAAGLGARAVRTAVSADVLVNCTSIGLDGAGSTFKQLPLEADDLARYRCVLDLVYTDSDTELVREARARSVSVVDGRELLVVQGALAFELFTGVPAPLDVMRAAVRVQE